ncbi:MAG: hypothetical protein QOI98_487 [Solirubrobacteraceae bacterium]|nr:hypothetical protein [Solirubrobacteraceae bacterium]
MTRYLTARKLLTNIGRPVTAFASRLTPALVVAGIAALGGPAIARAAWTDPVTLSPTNLAAQDAQVAIDTSGNGVVTWERFNGSTNPGTNFRAQARTRSASGQLGPIVTLAAADQRAEFPQLGVDAGGNAVFAWQRSDGSNTRIEARSLSSAGVLGPVQTLSDPGEDALYPRVAVFSNGNAIVTWQRFDGTRWRVQAVVRGASGAVGTVDTLSNASLDAAEPDVAFDGKGNAVFVWWTSDGTIYQAFARARSAAGTYGPEQPLDDGTQNALKPRLAVTAKGKAVFTWYRFVTGDDFNVRERVRSPAGALSPVQTLSDLGESALDPVVAVDGSGNAVFAWQRYIPGASTIRARARAGTGALSAIQTLSDADKDAHSPRIGVNSGGDSIVVWESDSSGNPRRILERGRSAAGTLGAIMTLSDVTRAAQTPQLAMNPLGNALVAFQRASGLDRRIQATAGP